MRNRVIHTIPALFIVTLVILPFLIAIYRLSLASDVGLIEAIGNLESRYQTSGALGFTLKLSLLSTVGTVAVGLPLAWWMARYKWRMHRMIRALLTTPFVMPSMVATIGFISLLGPQSSVSQKLGLDLWHSMTAIVIAHVWYNSALVIRLVEPAIARVDPSLEEAAMLLAGGNRKWKRMLRLWWPVVRPNLAAAATLTFVFSFTSFALVRHLGGPGLYNLERAMAERPFAGIEGVGAVDSEIVMALGMIQLVVLATALWMLTEFQKRGGIWLPFASEKSTRKPLPISPHRHIAMLAALTFATAPMIVIISGSFSINGEASLAAWNYAFNSNNEFSLIQPLINTIRFALLTLLIALPIAWITSQSVSDLEKQTGWSSRYARVLDFLVMTPFALSAVMVGYGVLIGVSFISNSLLLAWWLPLLAHLIIALPFAMRVLLPAMRALDKSYLEVAKTLGANPLKVFTQVHLPLLRGPLIVAGILAFAVSLGEFGATWLLWQTPDWTTLPVIIDRAYSRPYDGMARAAAHVAATILMVITTLLFIIAERFRMPNQIGEF